MREAASYKYVRSESRVKVFLQICLSLEYVCEFVCVVGSVGFVSCPLVACLPD